MAIESAVAASAGPSSGSSAQVASAAATPGSAASTPSADFLALLARLLVPDSASMPPTNTLPQQLDTIQRAEEALGEPGEPESADATMLTDLLAMLTPAPQAPVVEQRADVAGETSAMDAPIELNARDFMDVDLQSVVAVELTELASIEAPDPHSSAATSAIGDGALATGNMPAALESVDARMLGLLQPHNMHTRDLATSPELRAPLGTPAWSEELGTRLTWMARHGLESASLRITPEHLGPIDVSITFNEGEASVWFGAAHTDTRTALEQALPRLRELFAEQGLALADSGVFRDAPREQSEASASGASGIREAALDGDQPRTEQVSSVRLGLVDTFA